MNTIHEILASYDLAQLDKELIVSHVLNRPREWVIAHGDQKVTSHNLTKIKQLLNRRAAHEPLAYILGYREFYGRQIIVTPEVLVPRPETEELIELVKNLPLLNSSVSEKIKLLDVGCGSGIIGITIKCERPDLEITCSDISNSALKITRQNATELNTKINIIQSDLLSKIDEKFNIIVANLPYVDRSWTVSPELKAEPALALSAKDNGQELLKKIIAQAPHSLLKNGYLLLELDPRQKSAIKKYAQTHNFAVVTERPFALVLQIT
jgi:release factor glutamine methyltransferase